jgi:ribonuclease P protein component
VFTEGFRFFRNGLGFYARSNGGEAFRFGIVAPKRFGHAVDRNRFRRRVREVIRLSPEVPPGFDVVICVGKPCGDLGFDVIRKTLLWAWSRIRRASPAAPDGVAGG